MNNEWIHCSQCKESQKRGCENHGCLKEAGRELSDLETVARWAMHLGLSTGHADDIHDLLHELEWQVRELNKNSARYRFLRQSSHFGGSRKYDLRWYLPRGLGGDLGQQLDQAIDSQIKTDNKS